MAGVAEVSVGVCSVDDVVEVVVGHLVTPLAAGALGELRLKVCEALLCVEALGVGCVAAWDEEFEVVEALLGASDLCVEHTDWVGPACHGQFELTVWFLAEPGSGFGRYAAFGRLPVRLGVLASSRVWSSH